MNFLKLFESYYLDYRAKKSKQEIYYFELDNTPQGFFALLRMALDACCYADENGFLPYVKYGSHSLYFEEGLFLGTNNPFEYYYDQSIIIKQITGLKSINVIRGHGIHIDLIEQKYNLKPISYLVEETYIKQMAEIYKKYMKLNTRTHDTIEKSIKNLLNRKRTLGIHIRGTDFNKRFNNHPVPVTVAEYVEVIEREIKQYHYEQVFVATDDMRCLSELKEKISVPLVFYRNIMRSDDDKSVAFKVSERKHNHYLLGLEVLRDAYTLVSCEGFLGCLSQIDNFVQIIKLSKGQKFESLNIINKGICVNNRLIWEPRN